MIIRFQISPAKESEKKKKIYNQNFIEMNTKDRLILKFLVFSDINENFIEWLLYFLTLTNCFYVKLVALTNILNVHTDNDVIILIHTY